MWPMNAAFQDRPRTATGLIETGGKATSFKSAQPHVLARHPSALLQWHVLVGIRTRLNKTRRQTRFQGTAEVRIFIGGDRNLQRYGVGGGGTQQHSRRYVVP